MIRNLIHSFKAKPQDAYRCIRLNVDSIYDNVIDKMF